jgi:hypothetical protein
MYIYLHTSMHPNMHTHTPAGRREEEGKGAEKCRFLATGWGERGEGGEAGEQGRRGRERKKDEGRKGRMEGEKGRMEGEHGKGKGENESEEGRWPKAGEGRMSKGRIWKSRRKGGGEGEKEWREKGEESRVLIRKDLATGGWGGWVWEIMERGRKGRRNREEGKVLKGGVIKKQGSEREGGQEQCRIGERKEGSGDERAENWGWKTENGRRRYR